MPALGTSLVRPVSMSIAAGEVTHLERQPVELIRARAQHAAYVACIEAAGWRIVHLPAADEHPDAVFVEDTAVVVDECAVVTRPGAVSRRGEITAIASILPTYRPVVTIEAPGTLDGGDVLRLDRTLWVGVGARTNDAGAAQLGAHLAPFGYTVRTTRLRDCLHLKTAITSAAPGVVIVNPNWIDASLFADDRVITVPDDEPFGANVLDLGSCTLVAEAHPGTRVRLEAAGVTCRSVAADELAKIEGGLTCGCVLIKNP